MRLNGGPFEEDAAGGGCKRNVGHIMIGGNTALPVGRAAKCASQ